MARGEYDRAADGIGRGGDLRRFDAGEHASNPRGQDRDLEPAEADVTRRERLRHVDRRPSAPGQLGEEERRVGELHEFRSPEAWDSIDAVTQP